MNAITYIQQYGVEKAREVVEWWDIQDYTKQDLIDNFGLGFMSRLSDLKRLVESVDLVNDQGGLLWARTHVSLSKARSNYIEAERLEQAIADYEAIYSGEQHV